MSVLLRDAKIGLYYAGRKHWVGNPNTAADLKTIERAAELSRDENFERMEIVVASEDPACELVLPLRAKPTPGKGPAPGTDPLPSCAHFE
jgi:hypothetical protein